MKNTIRAPSQRVLAAKLVASRAHRKGLRASRSGPVHLNMGREALDMAMKFSKDGTIALHGKTKKTGMVWCGEEKAEQDITEVYKVTISRMGNCCSSSLAM